MTTLTIADFTDMTPAQKARINKPDLLSLLESQTTQTENISTNSLKDIVTECMQRVIDERLPKDLVETLDEVKTLRTELNEKTEEIKTLKKVIGEHQKVIESVQREKKANNVFVSGLPQTIDSDDEVLEDSSKVLQHVLTAVHPTVTPDDYVIVKDFDIAPGNTRHSMLIRFNEKANKDTVLKNCKDLKDKPAADPLRWVFMKHDQSPMTKKENDRIYQKFRELRETHKDSPNTNVRLKSGKLYINDIVHDEFNLSNQLF